MAETGLKIRIFGDAVLRKKARAVVEVTDYHRQLLDKMLVLMREASGIGLAAPQVGVEESLIVVDIGTGAYKLINPRIVRRGGSQVTEEGCLSVPGVCLKVRRAMDIAVEAQGERGEPVKIDAEGLLACVLQHEIDHLKGKLIVDYASLLDRIRIKQRLAQLKKRANDEKVSQSGAKYCKLQL